MLFGCFTCSDPLQGSGVKKQKIVIQVQMNNEKQRTEALKIGAETKGVSNVSVDAEKGHLVVIGVGIDSVHLTRSLRKKLDHAVIVSVQEVKKLDELKKIEYCYPSYPVQYYGYDRVCRC